MNPMTRLPAATPASGQRDILLGARALSKSYGVLRAVNSASLDLYPGEVVALVLP
jgi:ABC-type sugar transport system ATPase subunit